MTDARPWPVGRDLVSVALLALLAVPTLFLGLGTPAFMDNESRYAEVAREMLLSGDWMTPRLNFVVFLNKPPLAYWLTALTFEAVGVNEYGRLWVALTALGTLGVTFLLGRTLGGSRMGLLSSLVLLTSAGFFLEGRTLRPDLLLVLLVSTALLGFLKASQARTIREGTLWVYLSVFALALSVLAKGLVGAALVGATIGLTLLLGDRPAPGWRQVRWWPALLIALAVILPWYLVAGLRNPGFWWDSIVNQHALALVDRKLPRDSRPDSLLFFWGAFLIRTLPWGIYLPVAVIRAVGSLRHSRRPGTLLPAIWFGVVLVSFSLMPSRLWHYSLPALPAVALLVGGWWAEVIERRGARSAGALVAGASLVLIAVAGFVTVPWVVQSQAWAQGFPELTRPAALVFGVLIVGTGAALGSVWRGRPGRAFALLVLTILPQFFFVHRSLVLIEPINSWKSVGMAISRLSPRDGEVIFAASEEYQLCAGVNFYTGRSLAVWLPDGYVPPTYLDLGDQAVFLTRSEVLRRWQADRTVLLVVDPGRRAGDPALVPGPVWVVGRWGDRVLLANRPVSPEGRRTP